MSVRRGLAVALLLTASVGGAQGQEDVLGSLKSGQTVRVRPLGGPRFVTELDGSLDAARVDSLWVRGRATATGALVGAAVVAPVCFALFARLCTSVGEGQGCSEWGTVTGVSLMAGAGGALIGAGIGALVPRWRLRYARERDLAVGPVIAPGLVGLSVRF